ncbi:MAG TPA: tetratricopeptide repeat protein, partial [Polyangia bacterium]
MLNKKDKLLAAAQKFLERGSLDKALVEFQRAAQEDAKDTRTWLRIAEIHVKRGEAAQATQVYLRTAELYVEQGFFQRAAAVYKNVLKLTPGHTEAHLKLAEVYRQLGLLSDASQQFELAATALVRAGRPKEAMAALGQIIDMNPEQVLIRVKMGEVAAQGNLEADAVREFTRAAEQFEEQGRTDDYLRVAERLLQITPGNLALGKKAAIRYMERGNPKAALAKLQACFNADGKDVETLQLLANAFAELGQTAKTVTVLKELVKVQEERGQTVERNATLLRIRALDPTAAMPPGLDLPRGRPILPEPDAPMVAVPADRRRREPSITFSELAVPPILAREPSSPSLLSPADTALPGLDEEQVNTEIKRLLAETDTFIKYGLIERAAEHVRKVFDLDSEHQGAQERLIGVLVQLGRTAEAVEELGILADRRSNSDPDAAIAHLRRALELDPHAVGAKHMLERLTAKQAAAVQAEAFESLELDDIDDLELLPIEDDDGGGGQSASGQQQPGALDGLDSFEAVEAVEDVADADAEVVDDWQDSATQIDSGAARFAPQAAPQTSTPSMDELEIEFDLPVSASAPRPVLAEPPPLDAAVLSELEQVDFFLEQGLPDEALTLLGDIPAEHAGHPEVRARRERALGFGGEVGATTMTPVPDPLPVAPAARHAGAVPTGGGRSLDPSRAGGFAPRAMMGTESVDPTTQRDLGIAYKEMGLYDAAIAEFTKLVDDPDNQVFALMMIGECYEAEGAFAEALMHYKRAINRPAIRDEEATQLYFLLGRAFEALGDSGEALYFFEKVARRDPGFSDVSTRV